MKYRIKLSKRRKATGEHTFEIITPFSRLTWIEWNSNTGMFKYYGSNPTVHYGVYSLCNN